MFINIFKLTAIEVLCQYLFVNKVTYFYVLRWKSDRQGGVGTPSGAHVST
jgi:hypothetical protein